MVREHKNPKISVGIISLMVTLTCLCLTIFSVLTLSTAFNERRLSEKSAVALQNYYQAENNCIEIANQIGKIWGEQGNVTALQAYAEENNVDCKLVENEIYFTYQYPIDENQALFVTLCVGTEFEIQRWCVQATKEWEPEQSLSIWDGETNE